mmetsp:Transcript_88699/g.185417  ORF Transcript_88699/g.185417 Transcript_88699/m.185417 type:complete len:226 (+) Transcript_88699:143-820(+)
MNNYPSSLLVANHPCERMEENQFLNSSADDGIILPQVGSDPSLSVDDMDFLEKMLRSCNLHDPQEAAAARDHQQPTQMQADSAERQVHHNSPNVAAMGPWAEEFIRRLQSCENAEVARVQCAEMLAAFAQECQSQVLEQATRAQEERLRKLQGANGVLLRGFRGLYQRHRQLEAKYRQAEETYAKVTSELADCREQVRSVERAKSALQYHLQLMNTGPRVVDGTM